MKKRPKKKVEPADTAASVAASSLAHIRWDPLSLNKRLTQLKPAHDSVKKFWANKTPEERSEILRRRAKVRKENKRADRSISDK